MSKAKKNSVKPRRIPNWSLSFAASMLLVVGPTASHADPLSDAKAGLDALNRGDNDAAIRLFSQALNAGGLAPSDMELAYVKRAEAYAAEKNVASATADLDAAAKIDASDPEIAAIREQLAANASRTASVSTGPSFEETINFIIEKMHEHVSETHDDAGLTTITYQNISVSGCDISFSIHQNNKFSGRNYDEDTAYTYPLNKIASPIRVRPDIGLIGKYAVDDADDKYELIFMDEDTAQRVAKALAHAVDLCKTTHREPF